MNKILENELFLSAVFKALGHLSRFQMMKLIMKSPKTGVTPTEMENLLKIDFKSLSFHLDKLKNAKLVYTKKKGQYIYYFPNFETLQKINLFQ